MENTDGIPQFTIIKEDYGETYHETILNIFGDELTYNELKFYARNKQGTSYLNTLTEINNHRGFLWFSAFIDNKLILEKAFSNNHSCDMFTFLEDLRLQKEEEEEED